MKLGAAHQGDRGRSLGRVDRVSVPGYRFLERLEGPGEVWTAEGPGGFRAALRIVRSLPGGSVEGRPDAPLPALRGVRHPNIQAVFGSWWVGPVLVLASELPDATLWDVYRESVAAGLPGIPRDDLIEAVGEAARAIDYLNRAPAPSPELGSAAVAGPGPGLGHGDIAPRTIFYVGGGVKVADIDPDRRLGASTADAPPLYPLYAAPERLLGRPSPQSDQYSLAMTYTHLRVGRLAAGPEPRAVPGAERDVVARALAGEPDRRWPSCRAFTDALREAARADDRRAANEPRTVRGRVAAPGFGPGPGPEPGEIPTHPQANADADADADAVAAPASARSLLGRSAVLALVSATSAAALAGTVWLQRPPASASTALADGPGNAAALRVRLQDAGDAVAAGPPAQDPASAVVAAPPPPASVKEPPPPSSGPVGPEPDPRAAAGATEADVSTEAPAPRTADAPAHPVLATVPDVVATSPVKDGPAVEVQAPLAEPESPAAEVPPPGLSVSTPASLTVECGGSASLEVVVKGLGAVGPLEVRLEGLPHGLKSVPVGLTRRPDDRGTPGSVRVAVRAATEAREGPAVARVVVRSGESRAEAAVRLDVRPTAAVAARRRADRRLADGRHAEAIEAYSKALALDPADALAYHGRGLAAYHRGDHDQALRDLDDALRLRPGVASALNNRGLTRLARGEADRAIADFTEAIRADPAYALVRYNRGRAYAQAGDADRALADYDDAIRLDPDFAKAYRARASALSARGDRARALADYDTVLRLRPSDTSARNNRGLLLFAAGEPHRAIAEFDEAIRIDPKYVVARYNRGRVYHYLGDLTEALASVDAALRLDPSMTLAHEARAQILARQAVATRPGPGPSLGAVSRREPVAAGLAPNTTAGVNATQ